MSHGVSWYVSTFQSQNKMNVREVLGAIHSTGTPVPLRGAKVALAVLAALPGCMFHTQWAALLKGVDKTCQILTEPVNMTNPVVWKKWSGQNLASKSNPNTRTDSSNYKIYCSAQAHSTKSILTSPVLPNPIFSYFQSAVGLKNCKLLEVTDLNPCQNNNRKTGKHYTGFMREKIK